MKLGLSGQQSQIFMSNLNQWLKKLNVNDVYIGAGSRNASLVKHFNGLNQHYFWDERSLSFQALGHSKLGRNPVVICLTSGTAVSEVFSAVIEAQYSNIPLIILSADRPLRLRDSRAAQSINQNNIFSPFIETSYDGVIDEFDGINIRLDFPIHINFQIDDRVSDFGVLSSNESLKFVAIFSEGSGKFTEELRYIDKLGIPSYVESTSNLNLKGIKNFIRLEKDLLELIESKEVNSVIKFGNTPITKLWRDLDRFHGEIHAFSYKNKFTGLEACKYVDNLDFLKIQNINTANSWEKLESLLKEFPHSEPSLFQKIYKEIDVNSIAFVGNSMPIRYWEMIWDGKIETYASRGVNGIDGQIATAIGMARATKQKVVCIVGDITFLYDFNSHFIEVPKNLEIIVVNNNGGQIFKRIKNCDHMILSHSFDIENLVRKLNFEYIKVINPNNSETEKFWSRWNA